MNIQHRYVTHFLIAIAFPILLISCQSHEQKTDSAFELVKEQKLMSGDSEAIIINPVSAEVVKRAESMDDWSKFKLESDKRITANERKLREIKSLPNADAKLFKKISALEQENTDLRRQINEYAEALKVHLEEFKTKMNKDMDAINSDLNDLSVSGKK